MPIAKFLLRLARKVVENVMSQLTQQLNVVQQQAYRPMQMMVQQVVGGVWVGDGADAFVEEVQGLMMPGVNRVSDRITRMHSNIQHAVDVIDQADQQVNSLVGGLADVFDAIY